MITVDSSSKALKSSEFKSKGRRIRRWKSKSNLQGQVDESGLINMVVSQCVEPLTRGGGGWPLTTTKEP